MEKYVVLYYNKNNFIGYKTEDLFILKDDIEKSQFFYININNINNIIDNIVRIQIDLWVNILIDKNNKNYHNVYNLINQYFEGDINNINYKIFNYKQIKRKLKLEKIFNH